MFFQCLLLFVDALSVLSLGQVFRPRGRIFRPWGVLGRSWEDLVLCWALLCALERPWTSLWHSWSLLGWIFGRPGVILEVIF